MDSIRFFCVSFENSSARKVLASWFFGLDAFMWSRLFLGLELEDFHGFYQVFMGFFHRLPQGFFRVSFGNGVRVCRYCLGQSKKNNKKIGIEVFRATNL